MVLIDRWLETGIPGHLAPVVDVKVERSPKPEGSGSDVYLCGECGIILSRCPPGVSPRQSLIHCPNCGSLNQAVRQEPSWTANDG